VGWYSTGPKLRENDLAIHEVFRRYHPNPVLVIIDVQMKEELEIPTKAYVSVEEVKSDGTTNMKFEHITSEIGAVEAEEVGVEHLLRDVKDISASTLAQRVQAKLLSIRSLHQKLLELQQYLASVAAGRLPVNHVIIGHVQDIFNLLPNLSHQALVRSFAVKTNDMLLAIYLSSLIRSVIALHNLIRNKVALREAERKLDHPEMNSDKKPAAKQKEDGKKDDKKDDKKDTDSAAAKPSEKDSSGGKKEKEEDGEGASCGVVQHRAEASRE